MYAHLLDQIASIGAPSSATLGPIEGIEVLHEQSDLAGFARRSAAGRIAHWLQAHGLNLTWLEVSPTDAGWRFHLNDDAWQLLTPTFDTLSLHERLGTQRWTPELEIVIALLAAPAPSGVVGTRRRPPGSRAHIWGRCLRWLPENPPIDWDSGVDCIEFLRPHVIQLAKALVLVAQGIPAC